MRIQRRRTCFFSWKDMAVCLFLETIRTGAMRVIHIPVKTQETQRLRIKFVLYCPICAMAVSHLFVAEVKGSEQEAVPSGVFSGDHNLLHKNHQNLYPHRRVGTARRVVGLPADLLGEGKGGWERRREEEEGGGGGGGGSCAAYRSDACPNVPLRVCCPCAGATYVCSKLYSNDFRWV